MLMPGNKFKMLWDLLMAILLIYIAIFVPYSIAFIRNKIPAVEAMDYLIDICFGVDIILTFFCTFLDSNDKVITDRKKIASNYIKGWFFFDLLIM
jgi:hypothetical protein